MNNVIKGLEENLRYKEKYIADCRGVVKYYENLIGKKKEEISKCEKTVNEFKHVVDILIGIQNLRTGIKSKQNETADDRNIEDSPPLSTSESGDIEQG